MNGVDPTTITLIGGQILTVIAALAAAVVAIINALRMTDMKKQQEANTNQIVTVAKDTEAIKGHVNSEKTASEGRERLLENENKMLKEMISDKKMTASLLAQAQAQRGRGADPGPGASAASALDPVVLESIEANTAETAAAAAATAANTAHAEATAARTEAKVDDMKMEADKR